MKQGFLVNGFMTMHRNADKITNFNEFCHQKPIIRTQLSDNRAHVGENLSTRHGRMSYEKVKLEKLYYY